MHMGNKVLDCIYNMANDQSDVISEYEDEEISVSRVKKTVGLEVAACLTPCLLDPSDEHRIPCVEKVTYLKFHVRVVGLPVLLIRWYFGHGLPGGWRATAEYAKPRRSCLEIAWCVTCRSRVVANLRV